MFHEYVLPKFNPKISEFCINYTGISQEKIDSAKSIE